MESIEISKKMIEVFKGVYEDTEEIGLENRPIVGFFLSIQNYFERHNIKHLPDILKCLDQDDFTRVDDYKMNGIENPVCFPGDKFIEAIAKTIIEHINNVSSDTDNE